ncbi:MAG: SDR family oxidoreductase [Solibacillus sp.]
MNIFITGGTDFVGSYLCVELLKNSVNNLYVLSRSSKYQTAEERVLTTISTIIDAADDTWKQRIHVITGDLAYENLGIDENLYTDLCGKINVIYHCAASIDFPLDYAEAYKINVLGTKAILSFMENIQATVFERLNYISTADISQLSDKPWTEMDLNAEANMYEQTKVEAAFILRNYIEKGYPIIIHSPSIVNSSSKDSFTQENNIVFKFIKLLNRERLPQFFDTDDSSVNLVPVDYFVKSMVYLNESDENIGKTIHLVSPQNVLVKDVIQSITRYLNVKCPAFISFDDSFNDANKINYIFHYINHSHQFDNHYTQSHHEKVHSL